MKNFALIIAALLVSLVGGVAKAAYILTPTSGGGSSLNVHPGDIFTVDLGLTSNASNTHTSAVFNVQFSAPGLKYDSYTWKGTYAGSPFDNSQPSNASLPTLIGPATYGTAASPNDVHFENFTTTAFGTGNILSLTLEVPSNFTPVPTSISITAVPDTFSGSSGDVATSAGSAFTLNVSVPEPGSLSLLGIGVLGLMRRRKQ